MRAKINSTLILFSDFKPGYRGVLPHCQPERVGAPAVKKLDPHAKVMIKTFAAPAQTCKQLVDSTRCRSHLAPDGSQLEKRAHIV